MLHLQEDLYLKGATKENQETSKFNLDSPEVGTRCAKCTLHPEKERDGNQLALKSKSNPLGPHSRM